MASGATDDSYIFYYGRVGEGTTTTTILPASPLPFTSSTSASPPPRPPVHPAGAKATSAAAASATATTLQEELDDLTVIPFDDDGDDDDSEQQRRRRRSQNLGNRLRTASLDRCFEYFQHQQRQRRKSQGDNNDGDDDANSEGEDDQKPSAVVPAATTSATGNTSKNTGRNHTISKGGQHPAKQAHSDSLGRISTITDSTATSSSFSGDALSPGSNSLSVRVEGPSLPSSSSLSSSTPASAPSPGASGNAPGVQGRESRSDKGKYDADTDTRNFSRQSPSMNTLRYRYDKEAETPTPPPPTSSAGVVRHSSDSVVEQEKGVYRDERNYSFQVPAPLGQPQGSGADVGASTATPSADGGVATTTASGADGAAPPSHDNGPTPRGRSAIVTPPPSKKRSRSRAALRNFDFSAPLFPLSGSHIIGVGETDSSIAQEFFGIESFESRPEVNQGWNGNRLLEVSTNPRKEQEQEHHSSRQNYQQQLQKPPMYRDGHHRERNQSREASRVTPGENEGRSSSRLAETAAHQPENPSPHGGRRDGEKNRQQYLQQRQQERELRRNQNKNEGSNNDLAETTNCPRYPREDTYNAETSPHQKGSHRRGSSLPRNVAELRATVGEPRRQLQQHSSLGDETEVGRSHRNYRGSRQYPHHYTKGDEQNQLQRPSRIGDGDQNRDQEDGRQRRQLARSSPSVTQRDSISSPVKARQQFRPSPSLQQSPSTFEGNLEITGRRGRPDHEEGNSFHPPRESQTNTRRHLNETESPAPRERQRRAGNRIGEEVEESDPLAVRMRQMRPSQLPAPPMFSEQTTNARKQQSGDHARSPRQPSLPPTGRHYQHHQPQSQLSPNPPLSQSEDQEARRRVRSSTSGSGSSGASSTSGKQISGIASGNGEWDRQRSLHQRMSTLLDTIAQATEGLDSEVAERLRQSAMEEKRLAGDRDRGYSPAQPSRGMVKQFSHGNNRGSRRDNLDAKDQEQKEVPVTSTPPHSRAFFPRRQPSKLSTGASIPSLTPSDYPSSQLNLPTVAMPPPPLPVGRGRGPAISFGNGSFQPFQPRGGSAALSPPSTGRSQVAVDSYNRHNNTVIVGMSRNNNSTGSLRSPPSSTNLLAMAATGTPPVRQRPAAVPSSSSLSPSPMASPPTVKSTTFQAIAFTPVSSSTSSGEQPNNSATRSGSPPQEQHLIIHSEQYKSLVHRPCPVRAQPSALPPPPPIASAKSLSSSSLAAVELRMQAQQRQQEKSVEKGDPYRRESRRFEPPYPHKQVSPGTTRGRLSARAQMTKEERSQQHLSPPAVQSELNRDPRTSQQQPKDLLTQSHAHSSQVTVVTRGAGPRGGELLGFEGEASIVDDSGVVVAAKGVGGTSVLDPTSRCPPLDQDMKRIHDSAAENRILGRHRRRRRSFSIVKETVAARLALRRSKQLKPSDSASSLESDAVNHLVKEGFTFGLANTLIRNCDVFTMRLWLLDNSGSMSSTDGHRIVDSPKEAKPSIASFRNGAAIQFRKRFSGGNNNNQSSPSAGPNNNNNVKIVSCSRWEEVTSTVMWHAQISAMLRAPIVFRLLNDPGAPLKQQVSVAETANTNVEEEVRRVRETMRKARPIGHTPLTFHLQEVYRSLMKMKDRLQREHKLVSLVIVTDGLPTDESGRETDAASDEFFRVLRLFEGLPVWIVIRLSTDEERVINFYNAIDDTIHTAGYELDVDVLDDFMGEAVEVYRHNPWLNYALPLHLSRESGMNFDAMDSLDERTLELRELRELCCLLFDMELNEDASSSDATSPRQGGGGGVVVVGESETESPAGSSRTLADPVEDYHAFSKQLRKILKKESLQWNPIREKAMPWIDMKEMDRIYGHIHADVESLSDFGGSRSVVTSTDGDSSLRSNSGGSGRRSRLSKGEGDKCSIM